MTGQTYLCPEITGVVLEELVHNLPQNGSSAHTVLTPRQREALKARVCSRSDQEAAAMLGISVSTLRSHLAAIRTRLGVDSIAAVIADLVRGTLDEDGAGPDKSGGR